MSAESSGVVAVRCLPIAGTANPYQLLMMRGLAEHPGLDVRHGAAGRLFPFVRTAIASPRRTVIHLDWLDSYLVRSSGWLTRIQQFAFAVDTWLASRWPGVTLAWTLHNIAPHDRAVPPRERACRRAFARACAWIRVFSASSIDRASRSLDVDPSRFVVQAEGSYTGYYPEHADPTEPSERLEPREDAPPVIGYVGAVRPYKGLEQLLDAAEALPRARFLIAGRPADAEYAQRVSARVSGLPNVTCRLGFVDDADISALMRAIDIVCLPFARVENSGSAILAMGFAKPVVAPAMGVLVERLSGQPELLYGPGELTDTLAAALALAPERRAAIGRANRAAVDRVAWSDFSASFAPAAA